jgi:quercetin dioxygenase-like cupin family protein
VPANVQQGKSNYSVKSVETVVDGSDVKARIFTLAPGDVIPWHYHQNSTDHYFVLAGELSISTREPEVTAKSIPVGSSYKITAGTPHLVANSGETDCRFLLLQGVGTYDWIPAD